MASSPTQYFTVDPHGITLRVRLTPKGGRDAIDGVERLADGQAVLKARVRAAPTEGEANAALLGLLARALKVAPRQVSLAAGATARIKRVRIDGEAGTLAAAMAAIAERTKT
jgi:uncharacterized protein